LAVEAINYVAKAVEFINLHFNVLFTYVESTAYPESHHVQTPFKQYLQFNGHA